MSILYTNQYVIYLFKCCIFLLFYPIHDDKFLVVSALVHFLIRIVDTCFYLIFKCRFKKSDVMFFFDHPCCLTSTRNTIGIYIVIKLWLMNFKFFEFSFTRQVNDILVLFSTITAMFQFIEWHIPRCRYE